MADAIDLLAPPPRSLERTGERFAAPAPFTWGFAGKEPPAPAFRRFERAASHTGTLVERRDVADAFLRVELDRDLRELGPEGYRLSLRPGGALLLAAEEPGLAHGLTTLAQILRASAAEEPGARTDAGESLPLSGLEIDDRPEIPLRGVLLDVSRNRVPRMEHLYQRIEHLASLKVNHLQLYMEHTFAYRGHEEVWRGDDPFTAEEIQDLDRFCRDRHIELTPNQNSFGHFHRWLVHDRYRGLAEVPEGVDHPFGPDPEPFSLCAVDPAVLDLLRDLYDQLLPNFTSERFNVGLDETFDLGKGRSAAACALGGRHRVYLDYLLQVARLVGERDRRMLFWGDIVLEEPSLVRRLPSDCTGLVWGYEADHPFDEESARFAEAGVDFWLCPGTSSWLSFAGRVDNALGNLRNAADAARRHGAGGLLVADWGDWGHIQPPFASEPGLLVGASLAWNPIGAESWSPARWRLALDRHVFADPSGVLSQACFALGNAYLDTGAPNRHGSVLFSAFRFLDQDLSSGRYDGLTEDALRSTAEGVEEAASHLRSHAAEGSDADLIVAEMEWVARQLQLACRLLGARLRAGRNEPLDEVPAAARRTLAGELAQQLVGLESLFGERARTGGFRRTGALVQRWIDRLQPTEERKSNKMPNS